MYIFIFIVRLAFVSNLLVAGLITGFGRSFAIFDSLRKFGEAIAGLTTLLGCRMVRTNCKLKIDGEMMDDCSRLSCIFYCIISM